MNNFFNWISLQEAFIFKDIPFTILMVIVTYLIIICLTRLFTSFNYKNITIALLAIIIVQVSYTYTFYTNTTHDEFVVFHKSRYTLIGKKQGDNLNVSHNLDSITNKSDYILKNYKVGNFIKSVTENSLQNIYNYNNEKLLVIDSLGVYKNLSFKPDYVLLRQSPKLNLNRLIDSLKVKTIIADGSNYKSYIKRWKQTCLKRKIPFHYTGEKGAFILN
jgi:competence protein ComEC